MPGTSQALEPCAWGRAGDPQRTVQVSWMEIAEPKVPQQPHTAKQDKDSWVFASPVYTRYPLMSQLGGLLPQLTPGHQVPIQQLGRLGKVSYTRKQQQQHQRESNLEPLDYQTDALTTWLCWLTHTHTHHTYIHAQTRTHTYTYTYTQLTGFISKSLVNCSVVIINIYCTTVVNLFLINAKN